MVVPTCVPPLLSVVMRISTVKTPVPVMIPAEGGVRAHAGDAGTVRSTENSSRIVCALDVRLTTGGGLVCVPPSAATAGNWLGGIDPRPSAQAVVRSPTIQRIPG